MIWLKKRTGSKFHSHKNSLKSHQIDAAVVWTCTYVFILLWLLYKYNWSDLTAFPTSHYTLNLIIQPFILRTKTNRNTVFYSIPEKSLLWLWQVLQLSKTLEEWNKISLVPGNATYKQSHTVAVTVKTLFIQSARAQMCVWNVKWRVCLCEWVPVYM